VGKDFLKLPGFQAKEILKSEFSQNLEIETVILAMGNSISALPPSNIKN